MKCSFYTVMKDGQDTNETDRFLLKFKDSTYKQAVQELLGLILEVIGDKHGAIDIFFNRFENEVSGFPLKEKSGWAS